MKVYFIRHIPGRLENDFIALSPRRLLITEVLPVLGGIVISNSAVLCSTNRGNFAPITESAKKHEKLTIYKLNLGFEKLEILLIPDGVDTFIIDLKTWKRHKNRCLDLIEQKVADREFLLPTPNAVKILGIIREDLINYLLGSK